MKLNERLIEAVKKDPAIIADQSTIGTHEGSTLAYLESLGLHKQDLKRLERGGLAIRAYTYNGELVKGAGSGQMYKNFLTGMKVRWILFVPDKIPVKKAPIAPFGAKE